MKRILVVWSDERSPNLGVQVLAAGSAALAQAAFPGSEVATQNYGKGDTPVNIGMPKTLLRELVLNSRGLRKWIRGFDLVIDTRAGDSFTDIYGARRLRGMSAFAEFVRQCGVPVVLGPQTIGPFRGWASRRLGAWSLRQSDLAMARDHVSAGVAEELGRPVDALTTDVVFALPACEPAERSDVIVNVSGLLWMSDDHGPKETYRDAVRRLLTGLLARDREVTLLAHVLESRSLDNDVPVIRSLADEFSLRSVVPNDLTDVRRLLAGANLTFGSRMHACLNSLSVGTPAIPLAYSRKFAPLLGDIGWPHVVQLDASDPAGEALELASSVDDLARDADSARVRAVDLLPAAVSALRRLA